MKDEEYAKLLLESSFRESDAFWKRNTAFLITQGAFAGLYLKDLDPESASVFLAIVAGGLGVALSIAHAAVLIASKHYNMAWLGSLENFACSKAKTEQERPKGQCDCESPDTEISNWAHLLESIAKNAKAPMGHSTQWAMTLPYAFALLWIAAVLLLIVNRTF